MNLNEMQAVLIKEGIYSRIVNPLGVSEATHIEIDLDEDHSGRDQIMKIKIDSQEINSEVKYHFTKIEFLVEYPFGYNPLASSDLARLIAFLNRFSDMPGFELDEVEQKILFRHVFLGKEDQADPIFLTSIIGLILMYIDLNVESIEKVAKGERSFDSVITELLSELNYL